MYAIRRKLFANLANCATFSTRCGDLLIRYVDARSAAHSSSVIATAVADAVRSEIEFRAFA